MIYHGDCLDILKSLPNNSLDCMITDPPAGIGFMGKEWDKDKGGRKEWCAWLETIMRECLRVLKPGAHALVWSLPRTSHWTAIALEDAGFEIRDSVYHIFGSGFPKSMDISKAIDKAKGLEREVLGTIKKAHISAGNTNNGWVRPSHFKENREVKNTMDVTTPNSPEAHEWNGWGTALKPAVEQWWLVRKPLSEKTIVENILKWGCGGINIDACRVPDKKSKKWTTPKGGFWATDSEQKSELVDSGLDGFPTHLILDGSEEVIELFPITKSGQMKPEYQVGKGSKDGVYVNNEVLGKYKIKPFERTVAASIGSAARFFYCAKPSPREKTAGLEDKNSHPTIKPQALMEYFAKLIAKPGGTVLDPFMGSGSMGVACVNLGLQFIGIELEKEYFEIAKARIDYAQKKLPEYLKSKEKDQKKDLEKELLANQQEIFN